jgi:hypothetical protein
MISVFNRKELFMTYDMQRQIEIRTFLRDHNIEHRVIVKNLLSPSPFSSGSRARTGTFGVDLTKTYEYKIYVKKTDYEQAKYLMNSAR